MSEELKPCHCGYKGTIAWINHQGDYLSAICPECKRTVVHDTLVGLIKSWNTGQEAATESGPVAWAARPTQGGFGFVSLDKEEAEEWASARNACVVPVYAPSPASADAVSVPRELLERTIPNLLYGSARDNAEELRALLAQQEVKP